MIHTINRGKSCAAWPIWLGPTIFQGWDIVRGGNLGDICGCLQLLPGMLKLWGLLLFLHKEAIACHSCITPSGACST